MATNQEGEWSAENGEKREHGRLRPEDKAYDHEILTQRCP